MGGRLADAGMVFVGDIANLSTDPPGRFEGYAERHLQRADGASPGRCKRKVEGIKPIEQAGTGILKDGARTRVDVMAAISAGIRSSPGNLVKGCVVRIAAAAGVPQAITNFHDVGEAGIVVGETVEKVADCEGVLCGYTNGHRHCPVTYTYYGIESA